MSLTGHPLDGAIRVRTTEWGLPVEVSLTHEALDLAPERLAREVLLRCRESARHAQVARRERLAANGVAPAMADALGLSTAGLLAEVRTELAELVDDFDDAAYDGRGSGLDRAGGAPTRADRR